MIKEISLENFRNHSKTTIRPGRVTALVGTNGSGKTSLLKGLNHLTKSLQRIDQGFSWDSYFQGDCDPAVIVRRGQTHVSFGAEGGDKTADWSIQIGLNLSPNPSVPSKSLPLDCKARYGGQRYDMHQASLKDKNPLELARKALGESFYFKGIGQNIARPTYSPHTTPLLEADGSYLASVIAYLMTNERGKVEEIEKSLRAIVPIVRQIRVKPTKLTWQEKKVVSINGTQVPYEEQREVIGHQLLIDTNSADEVPADALSEGTLLVLAVLTVLWGPACPKLILLDDVEQGLHPIAQRETMQILRQFAEQQQRQIIVTSHSPYIIDELDPQDVWVMATDAKGVSITKCLKDHPDSERLKQVLTTGELIGAVGEDWVIHQAQ
ncbi:MAG: AAA family ATPase [Acidobacteria bacterium]|nr:AAA family ATPase [Acidobacteriota bacterium]MCW5971093.1 AAA family ATPase [Blastocatellales bacterium]